MHIIHEFLAMVGKNWQAIDMRWLIIPKKPQSHVETQLQKSEEYKEHWQSEV